MDSQYKNYELAYLLSPSLPEAEALTYAGNLTTMIEESKGAIRKLEEPKKRQLAYLVSKQKIAYFGWTTFNADPDNIEALKKKLRGEKNILRYLLVEEEEAMLRPMPLRTIQPRPARPRPIPREAPKPAEEKLDLEALDKKLEEILGK